MNLLGIIDQCLGAECPTPCCPNEVYILPEELDIVLGTQKNLISFSDNKTDKNLIRFHRSFISQCFDKGCKIETCNPEASPHKPQKGSTCIAFPLLITNKERISLKKINLSMVSPSQCPLVSRPDVILDHYQKFEVMVKKRFPFIQTIHFDGTLAIIMGEKEVCLKRQYPL